MMTFRLNKSILSAAVIAACSIPAYNANAGGTITFGEDQSVSVGFGMRGSYTGSNAPNGATSDTNNFSLDSARIFLSGSLNKYIKGMLNTEKDIAGEGFQAIDANVQIEIAPEFTIWAGRFLSPSDRANLAGPYYSLGGGYWSGIASRYGYNGGYIGRDDGVAAVGSLLDGKLSYSVGAFEGNTAFKIAGVPIGVRTGSDGLMYAGRVQVDFWDAEPGYYGTGNYLGAKDILAVGVAGRYQKGGSVGTSAGTGVPVTVANSTTGDYSSYSVDFLLEKKDVGPGAVSLEAAYYDYDTDNVFLGEQGKAYSAGAGYIFNDTVGWGKFQPFVRFQKFQPDSGADDKRTDLGTAYIIDGYNAQLSGYYSHEEKTASSNINAVNVAMQFQF
jgi:uncharacterized protein YdeI (BOF family)